MTLPDQFLVKFLKGKGMVKGFAPVYPNIEYEISRTAPKSHELLVKKMSRADGQSITEATSHASYLLTSAQAADGKTVEQILLDVQHIIKGIKHPEQMPHLEDPQDQPFPQTIIEWYTWPKSENEEPERPWSNLRGAPGPADEAAFHSKPPPELAALAKAKTLLVELVKIPRTDKASTV